MSVELKYFEGKPVIEMIKRVSRPGPALYKNKNEIPRCSVVSVSPSYPRPRRDERPRKLVKPARAARSSATWPNKGNPFMSRVAKAPVSLPKGVTITSSTARKSAPRARRATKAEVARRTSRSSRRTRQLPCARREERRATATRWPAPCARW